MAPKKIFLLQDKVFENEDNENIYHDFDFQLYKSLIKYGEKMRFICIYNSLTDDDLRKISCTIDHDILNGIIDDPKYTLRAIIVLLKYNVNIQINSIISQKIIELFQQDELIKECTNLVFNFLFKDPKYYNNNKKMIIENTIEKLYDRNPGIMKLWIRLSNSYNFEIPLDFFESLFFDYFELNFKQKKCLINLCCALLMKNQKMTTIFLKNIDFLEIFLIENIENYPDQVLFIISTLNSSIVFSNEFNLEIIDRFNLLI